MQVANQDNSRGFFSHTDQLPISYGLKMLFHCQDVLFMLCFERWQRIVRISGLTIPVRGTRFIFLKPHIFFITGNNKQTTFCSQWQLVLQNLILSSECLLTVEYLLPGFFNFYHGSSIYHKVAHGCRCEFLCSWCSIRGYFLLFLTLAESLSAQSSDCSDLPGGISGFNLSMLF